MRSILVVGREFVAVHTGGPAEIIDHGVSDMLQWGELLPMNCLTRRSDGEMWLREYAMAAAYRSS